MEGKEERSGATLYIAEAKRDITEGMRAKLAQARLSMLLAQPRESEAYYDGKASAFAEAVEMLEEVSK